MGRTKQPVKTFDSITLEDLQLMDVDALKKILTQLMKRKEAETNHAVKDLIALINDIIEKRSQKKGNKYNAVSVVYDGKKFLSKAECEMYKFLQDNSKELMIKEINTQKRFKMPGMKDFNRKAITYVLDFDIVQEPFGKEIHTYLETKGALTLAAKYKMSYCENYHDIWIHIIPTRDKTKYTAVYELLAKNLIAVVHE